jgi:hypothetical protein
MLQLPKRGGQACKTSQFDHCQDASCDELVGCLHARSLHGTVPSLKPLIVVQHTTIREEERLSELETSRGALLAIIGCFQGCGLDLSLVQTPVDLPEEISGHETRSVTGRPVI